MQTLHIRTASLEHLRIQHWLAHSMHDVVKTLGSWWPILSPGWCWLAHSILLALPFPFLLLHGNYNLLTGTIMECVGGENVSRQWRLHADNIWRRLLRMERQTFVDSRSFLRGTWRRFFNVITICSIDEGINVDFIIIVIVRILCHLHIMIRICRHIAAWPGHDRRCYPWSCAPYPQTNLILWP
jgi:hypothetical protein